MKKIADEQHAAVLPICAEIEAEISGMDPEEKELFLADMGLTESALTASSTRATPCSVSSPT